eukprot:m.331973 g.331973  ORF g.331973 m.331973 type:complete len:102 (+) comp16829_c0_seq1:41-346(+)
MASLTLEQAQAATKEVMAILDVPENIEKLTKAKEEAAGDLMKLLTGLVPLVVGLLGERMVHYGFTADQPGVMGFVAAMNPHNADPEVAAGKARIMSLISGQ